MAKNDDKATTAAKSKRPPAVTAEQTSESNAHAIVDALHQELERDGGTEN